MIRKLLLLASPIVLISSLQLSAQGIGSCAESRVSAVKRTAVASPAHQRLMNLYDVTFYKLDLQLGRNTTYIAGNATIAAKVKDNPLASFAFELHQNFAIDSVVVNGERKESINHNLGEVTVQLSEAIAPGSKVSAAIYYKGTAPGGSSAAIGNGFSTATEPTWNNQVTWSLSQPYSAYEWWPTKQVLTDKADSVHVFVITSAENKVGSNGILTKIVDLPDNKKRYEWKSNYPIDYYLVSVAVSNYEEYLQYASPAGAAAPVPILNYLYNGSLSTYKDQLDKTPGYVEYFSELFGLYPFHEEKYGHSMAPMGGGMEHQTMTTQSTFSTNLTTHELAHQWFGDNVTCASWEDIWLNEGFASYAEYLALQRFEPDQTQHWLSNAQSSALTSPTGSVKVPDTTNVSRIFSGALTYDKGGLLVHMLRFEINDDDLFFTALRNYQQQFRGGTATTADLQRVVEQTTNKQFDYFFDQWYEGNGFPVFSIEWNQQDNQLLIISEQHGSGTTPFFQTDMEYRVTTTNGTTTIRVTQNQPTQHFLTQVDGLVLSIEPDPNNWILKQVTRNAKNEGLIVTGVKAPLQHSSAKVFPNPVSSSVINVADLGFSPTIAKVYDTAGKLLKSQSLNSEVEVNVEVSDLTTGVYQLLLSDGKQTYRACFVKIN